MPEVIDCTDEKVSFTNEEGEVVNVTVSYTLSREPDGTISVDVKEIKDEDGDAVDPDDFETQAIRMEILESVDPAEFDEYEGNFDPDRAREDKEERKRLAEEEGDEE